MQIKTQLVLKKGGLAAFFLACVALLCTPPVVYANTSPMATRALQAGLAQLPMWSALLHVTDGKAHITSEDFLLSGANFSLENELVATISGLYGTDAEKVCRFPARYLWLKSQIAMPDLPITACAELNEFKRRAPADEIAVVFASENLAQPSSMMGHIFLKLSGANERQQQVTHAVSFITDAGEKNVVKLFFDSMVVGKAGFFTLGPYEEKLELYLREEQRTLWEYALALNPAQRDLVQAHLMELKQTRFTYFFQHYNCATVIDFILAVAAAKQLPIDGLWVTPKDVVKRLNARGLLKSSQVLPPNRWVIRAISEQLSPAERAQIQADVDRNIVPEQSSANGDLNPQFIRLQLARAYHGYRMETKQAEASGAKAYSAALRALEEEKFPSMRLETTSFKNPIDTPQDSQTEFGLHRTGGNTYVRFSFTPVSHHLADDNRQYFAETELLLLDFSILKDIASRKILLDRLVLYGAKSLIPHDAMSGGVSGAFKMGIAPQRDASFRVRHNMFADGALGWTKRIGRDIDVFGLAGAGMSGGRGGFNLYAQPEIGIIVREIFDLKTVASVQLTANALGERARTTKYKFEQAKFFPGEKFSLHFTAELIKQSQHRARFIEFSGKYLF